MMQMATSRFFSIQEKLIGFTSDMCKHLGHFVNVLQIGSKLEDLQNAALSGQSNEFISKWNSTKEIQHS